MVLIVTHLLVSIPLALLLIFYFEIHKALQPQRFLSCHGVANDLFRFGCHLMKVKHYRSFRKCSFSEWMLVSWIPSLDSTPFNYPEWIS